MKFCAHCGEQLSDEAVVCTKCGCAVRGGPFDKKAPRKASKNALFGRFDWIPLCFGAISAFSILLGVIALVRYTGGGFGGAYAFEYLCSRLSMCAMPFAVLAVVTAIPQLSKEKPITFYGLLLGAVCALAEILICLLWR